MAHHWQQWCTLFASLVADSSTRTSFSTQGVMSAAAPASRYDAVVILGGGLTEDGLPNSFVKARLDEVSE